MGEGVRVGVGWAVGQTGSDRGAEWWGEEDCRGKEAKGGGSERVSERRENTQTHMHTHMHTHIHVHITTHVHTHTDTHMHATGE